MIIRKLFAWVLFISPVFGRPLGAQTSSPSNAQAASRKPSQKSTSTDWDKQIQQYQALLNDVDIASDPDVKHAVYLKWVDATCQSKRAKVEEALGGSDTSLANSVYSSCVKRLQALESNGGTLGASCKSFSVGAQPTGIAFDGTDLWVANNSGASVSKLEPNSGIVLGTFPVGSYPTGMAFDGANIWVADYGYNGSNDTVTVLKASTGQSLPFSPVRVGRGPRMVTFDGANIWVTNETSNTVTKIRASDGIPVATYSVGVSPDGIAFDGANIWVNNSGSNTVTKLRATDGELLGTYSVDDPVFGIAFDGSHMWVVSNASRNVTEFALNGTVVRTVPIGAGGHMAGFDGVNIWVANYDSNSVTKIRASDGNVQGTFAVSGTPWGVAFDGANLWVSNFSGSNIWKFYSQQPAGAQGTWLGFANGNVTQDRDAELRRNCGDFRRVYVPPDVGNKFTELCNYVGRPAKRCAIGKDGASLATRFRRAAIATGRGWSLASEATIQATGAVTVRRFGDHEGRSRRLSSQADSSTIKPLRPPLDAENFVRSENTEVPVVREIMVATTMSFVFVALSFW